MRAKSANWPTNQAQHAYMKMRQVQNRGKRNANEEWVAAELGVGWTRQAIWGYRIFDFWNDTLGVAIEVDGSSHDREWDAASDARHAKRSAIIVFRIPNGDQDALDAVLEQLKTIEPWLERRRKRGLLTKAQKRQLGISD